MPPHILIGLLRHSHATTTLTTPIGFQPRFALPNIATQVLDHHSALFTFNLACFKQLSLNAKAQAYGD